MRQIMKKWTSYEIKIYKGKANQTRKLQKCIIHPNALEYLGNYCPVALLDSYLVSRVKLGHTSNSDYLFPSVGSMFAQVFKSTLIQIQIPFTPVTYDNFQNSLQKHLDYKELLDMGVHLEDYSTHSFRLGGNSVITDDKVVMSAFL